MPATSETDNRDKLPIQSFFIVGNEACERFSYYGIQAILTTYMVGMLIKNMPQDMAAAQATTVGHAFKCLVYLTPLLGAWIADRWLGRYHTILYVSLLYCLGHLVLALTMGTLEGLYAGLFLIALGAGGIKPCVSTFVGDQFGPDQQHLLPKVYGLFYWAINFGSFFSFGIIPAVRDNYGYNWAFGIPGIAMAVATLILWSGRNRYVRIPPAGQGPRQAGVLKIWWTALCHRRERQPGDSWIDAAHGRFTPEEVAGAKAVAGILTIFACAPFFWALYDQTSTTWIIQGNQMQAFEALKFHLDHVSRLVDLLLRLIFAGTADPAGGGCTYVFRLDADRMQSFNPLLIMGLIPLFMWLYPKIEKACGFRISPLRRMTTGMALLAASFVVVGWLQLRIDGGEKISILWQMFPYVLLTVGEVLFSATGLEFSFSQAPRTMKSTIMSFWLLSSALGNGLVAFASFAVQCLKKAAGTATPAASHSAAVPPQIFFLYAGLLFVVTGIFVWRAIRYQEHHPDAHLTHQ